jgi:putative phosphoesterase
MTDLHIDLNQFGETELKIIVETLRSVEPTHIHLAGDLSNDAHGDAVSLVNYLEESLGVPVTFNLGNHDMTDLSENEIRKFPDKHALNFATRELSTDTVLFAFNGWYDYSFARGSITDPEKILRFKNTFWYDRKIERSQSDIETTELILAKLRETLPTDKKVIVATHFIPKEAFINYSQAYKGRWNTMNAFMGSEKFGELFEAYPNISQVVFGHTHYRQGDKMINGILYSERAFGYGREWQLTREFAKKNSLGEFENELSISKIYRKVLEHPDFEEYKWQHLSEELLKAMTIIEY